MATGSAKPSATQVARRLVAEGVEAVALLVVDNPGITRVKTIPIGRFAEVAKVGVGLSSTFAVFLSDDSMTSAPGFEGPSGDVRLVPDPAATVALAAMPGWAASPVDQMDQDGGPWVACPRTFARTMLGRLERKGLELRGAFEMEFFLGRRTPVRVGEEEPEPMPSHTGPGYGADVLAANEPFATALIRALEMQGTGVMQFHPEYSTGQMEVSIPHVAGLAIADTNLILRQTIRAVAASQGLAVSFAPVVFAGLVGNGAHLHFSLWDRRGRNLFAGGRGPHGMGREAEAFAAGVLSELPSLVAISCPTLPSYQRLQPHHWSGAFTAWGRENREAALRFVTGISGTERQAANLELKTVDGAGNPYLVLGSVIAAGLAGIDGEASLPEGTTQDPGSLSAKELRRLGIRRLPTTLGEAVDALEGSTLLRSAMGDGLFEPLLASRRADWEKYRDADEISVIRAQRWRY
jgi:glutamine synthetase